MTVFGDHGHVGRRKIDDDDDKDHDHHSGEKDDDHDESYSRSQRNIKGPVTISHTDSMKFYTVEIISFLRGDALCGYPLVKVPVEKFPEISRRLQEGCE